MRYTAFKLLLKIFMVLVPFSNPVSYVFGSQGIIIKSCVRYIQVDHHHIIGIVVADNACVTEYNPFPSDTNCTISSTDTVDVTNVMIASDVLVTSGKIIIMTTYVDQENSITITSTAVLEGTSSRFQHINVCGEGRLSFTFI